MLQCLHQQHQPSMCFSLCLCRAQCRIVLLCVAAFLQCVCSVFAVSLQWGCSVLQGVYVGLQCVAGCLWCVAVRCSVLQCLRPPSCCSVLQCIAAYCSVLQSVAFEKQVSTWVFQCFVLSFANHSFAPYYASWHNESTGLLKVFKQKST